MRHFKLNPLLIFAVVALYLPSCKIFKPADSSPATDLVCGMKVDKSEGYKSKFNGTEYYFDSYNCKKTFDMSPEKFINNKCVKVETK
jgi:YHS domain-containing protein